MKCLALCQDFGGVFKQISSLKNLFSCEESNETLPAIAGGTCCLGPDGPYGC
ncbi:hypothetical protein EV12_3065 [Prochlorococcus sp. MIT 0701]|nr:hypothetical protein EV12_3065 [Prochlorococcus sp. MIT 0701]